MSDNTSSERTSSEHTSSGPTPAPPPPPRNPLWLLVAGLGIAVVGFALEPSGAQSPTVGTQQTRILPNTPGGNADSNGRMIAVTGYDVTGASILYLVDTIDPQIAIYQANGGGASTRGIQFVGARNITLDLQLDGFNDKTELDGKPLGYKDLRRKFESEGLEVSDD